MTREEAKEIIFHQWQSFLENNIDYAGISEAYKMAISALSESKGDLISRQAVLCAIADTIGNGGSIGYELLEKIVSEIPPVSVSENPNKCFDGMTNGEVIQALFPNCLINKTDNWVNIHIDTLTPFSREWWNAPYKEESPETCKGCLEPCIMYEPDMRGCKKKVTERGE